MDHDNIEDRILAHLRTVAHTKRALLQTAVEIADDYPARAGLLLTIIQSLTRSADKLLGDTSVLGEDE